MRIRQFSADIIDKIGERHLGLKVPLPKNNKTREQVINRVGELLKKQTTIRADIAAAAQSDMRM